VVIFKDQKLFWPNKQTFKECKYCWTLEKSWKLPGEATAENRMLTMPN